MSEYTETAQWYVELRCDCPNCDEWVNLLDYTDFFDQNSIDIPEHGTERTKNMEVVCPECYDEFNVNLVW